MTVKQGLVSHKRLLLAKCGFPSMIGKFEDFCQDIETSVEFFARSTIAVNLTKEAVKHRWDTASMMRLSGYEPT